MNGLYRLSIIFFLAIRHWIKVFIFYSGIAFIIDKASPSKDSTPKPTLVIWLVTIYIAVYGIAVQRYERDSNRYQTEFATFLSMLTSESYVQGVYNITSLLNETRILDEPEIDKPESIYKAFWGIKQRLQTNKNISQLEKAMSILRGRNSKCYNVDKHSDIKEFIVEEFKFGEEISNFEIFLKFLHHKDSFFNVFLTVYPSIPLSECRLLNFSGVSVGDGSLLMLEGFNANVTSVVLDRDFNRPNRNVYNPHFSYSEVAFHKDSLNDNSFFSDNGVYQFSVLTFINNMNYLTGSYRFNRLVGYGYDAEAELQIGVHEFDQPSFMFNNLVNIKNSCDILKKFPWNVLANGNCSGIRTYRTYRELFISYLESKEFRLEYDRYESDLEKPDLDDVVSYLKSSGVKKFPYAE